MITGHITKRSNKLEPRLAEILDWLADLDEKISVGTYPLCKNFCQAVVMETDTSPADEKPYEAHRRYLDIHYDLRGGETIECAPVERLTEAVPYRHEDDVVLLQGECVPNHVVLCKGDICILFPEDGHKPCCASDKHSIKMVVVKVPADWMSPEIRICE